MLTVHLAGPCPHQVPTSQQRREFMTSQSDIQWVDLCVFVYVTLLCLSLANLSIQYVNHKHQACPSPCLESCEEFSSTHSPAYSKSHRLCTLNFPLVWCFWLIVYMFVLFLYGWSFFVKIYFGFGWWHYVIGRFCMMYACHIHDGIGIVHLNENSYLPLCYLDLYDVIFHGILRF